MLIFEKLFSCEPFHLNDILKRHASQVGSIDSPIAFLLLLVLAAACMPIHVQAADWVLTPKIGVSGGYDDNITFVKNDKVDSSIVVVEPGLEIEYQTLLSSLRLTSDFDIISYLDESDLNRVDQYHRLQGDRRFGQRWDARLGLRFFKDSTLRSYLEETGQLVDDVERDYYYASGGISYDITNVSSIDANYFYTKAQYEDDIFPEYDRHQMNLSYRHRLKSEVDILSIGPSFYHRSNDRNDTDYASLDIGWERDWSKITNTLAVIGARYTNVEDKGGNDEDTWGVKARFNLTRKGIASEILFTILS